jgi:type IV secretory pathway VirB2 component (pilin)
VSLALQQLPQAIDGTCAKMVDVIGIMKLTVVF